MENQENSPISSLKKKNIQYEIGDIVNIVACSHNYSSDCKHDPDSWCEHYNLIGTIIDMDSNYFYKYSRRQVYIIKLIEEHCNKIPSNRNNKNLIPREEFTQINPPGDDNGFLSMIMVVKESINFRLDREITTQQFVNAPLNEKFRMMLAGKWGNLIFRNVFYTKTGTKGPYMVKKRGFDEKGEFYENSDKINKTTLDHNQIGKEYSVHYNYYDGFTNKKGLRDNDPFHGKSIYFSKKGVDSNYTSIELTPHHRYGWFNDDTKGECSIPPRKEQIICGIVRENDKGLYYKKWFICSPEFLYLWTLVRKGPDPNLNKETILRKVDCSHYSNYKYNNKLTTQQKNARLICNNYEDTVKWNSYVDIVRYIIDNELDYNALIVCFHNIICPIKIKIDKESKEKDNDDYDELDDLYYQ